MVSFDDLRPDEVVPSLPNEKILSNVEGITDFSAWKGVKMRTGISELAKRLQSREISAMELTKAYIGAIEN